MTKYILTAIDTTGIQAYIFSSNRLRENIGASYLVDQATGNWVGEQLQHMDIEAYIPNADSDNDGALLPRIHSENNIDAELVYAGGGNTVLLFKNLEVARSFVHSLSRRILEEAPGLTITAAHREFYWDHEKSLQSTFDKLISQDLAEKKHQRHFSSSLLGLSVTTDCNSTRLVAIGNSNDFRAPIDEGQGSYPVSREVSQKLRAVPSANEQLRNIFSRLPRQLQFPHQFDHLGRTKGESSYIAVVHADGNNMGDRFRRYCNSRESNEAFIQAIRELSNSINRAGQAALLEVLREVRRLIVEEEFHLPEDHQYFPFRPLVYGGDDVTFVCDGRLGLTLAAKYLAAFEAQETVDKAMNGGLTACAGIAIVKTHYPFARAYALGEALCAKAKSFVRAEASQGPSFSALDWHIANTGLMGSIDDIREREYQVESGTLSLRPIRLQSVANEWRTWEAFQRVVEQFANSPEWKGRRNKVMALRDVLRNGPDATREFLAAYRLKGLPTYQEAEDPLAEQGWLNGECGYFDAIEAIDYIS